MDFDKEGVYIHHMVVFAGYILFSVQSLYFCTQDYQILEINENSIISYRFRMPSIQSRNCLLRLGLVSISWLAAQSTAYAFHSSCQGTDLANVQAASKEAIAVLGMNPSRGIEVFIIWFFF